MIKKSVYLALIGAVSSNNVPLGMDLDFVATLPCHQCIRAGYVYKYPQANNEVIRDLNDGDVNDGACFLKNFDGTYTSDGTLDGVTDLATTIKSDDYANMYTAIGDCPAYNNICGDKKTTFANKDDLEVTFDIRNFE